MHKHVNLASMSGAAVFCACVSMFAMAPPSARAAGAGDVHREAGDYDAYKPGFRVDYGLGKMDGIAQASPDVVEYAQLASLPSDEERKNMLAYATVVASGNDKLQANIVGLYKYSVRVADLGSKDPEASRRWNELRAHRAEAQALVGKARWGNAEATASIEQQLRELKRGPLGEATATLNKMWSGLHWDLVQRGSYEAGGTAVMTILASATEEEARNRLLRNKAFAGPGQAQQALTDMLGHLAIIVAEEKTGGQIGKPQKTTLGDKRCIKVMYNNPDGTPDTSRPGYDSCI